jgi:ligand-binding sensor domain-containing protein
LRIPGLHIVLLLACLAAGVCVHAQTSYHIGVEDGLAANALTTVIRDHNNYMWFGSYNGIYQHQGRRIRRYARVGRDSLSLSGCEMHSLFEDHSGTIWIGTTSGLDRINPATGLIRHYRLRTGPDASVNVGYIYSIFEDRERYIWVSTDMALFRLAPESGTYQIYSSGTDAGSVPSTVTGYHQGLGNAQGFLLSTTGGLAYYSYRTHRFTHRYNSDAPFYRAERGTNGAGSDMCADDSGRIYFVANASTLIRLSLSTGTADSFNFPRPEGAWPCCYSLARDYKGCIWMGFRHGGIVLFNPVTKSFLPIRQESHSKLIQSNYISGLCEDYQHHMWVTTDEGIDVIDYYGDGLQLFKLSDAPDFKKLVYSSGLMSRSGRNQLVIPFPRHVRFTFNTESGRIEEMPMHSYEAAVLPDGSTRRPAASGMLPPAATDKSHGRKNAVWVYEAKGVRYEKFGDGTLTRIERDGTLRRYITHGFMKQACVSRDGNTLFFMGRNFDIVSQDIASGRTDTLRLHDALAAQGFPMSNSRDMTDDGRGNIWVCAQNGLLRYNTATKKLSVFTTADGLSENFTYSLVSDNAGAVWVGTLGGVDWFDAASGTFRHAVRFRDATYMDAFGSALKMADGTLYFHAGNKLLRVRPEVYLRQLRVPPRLLINEVLINGRQLAGAQDPLLQQLTRSDNRLLFRYGLLDFTNADGGCRVQHRLRGLESEWTSDDHGEAAYAVLPPGHYTFEVRVLAADGHMQAAPVSASFYIRPAFWQTWWARALGVLLVAAIATILVRRRIRTIQVKAALKQTMTELESRALRAQMNPHFIFNSLNAIQELVIRQDTTAAYQYLSKFSKLLRMVLRHAERSVIPLSDELDMYHLYLALEELRFNHSFCYLIRIDEPLDTEAVHIPPMLLQPYLENAIWHGLRHKSGDKVLDIHFQETDGDIVCTITDNGIGRPAAMLLRKGKLRPHGDASRGMSITQQRIALVNKNTGTAGAGIEIKDLLDPDGEPAGTQVIIRLAAGAAPAQAFRPQSPVS